MAHGNAETPATRPLGPSDEMFLRLDTIRTVGHGSMALVFDTRDRPAEAFGAEQLREQVADKLPLLGPLRWRLGSAADGHHWVDGEAPDLHAHVAERDLGGDAGTPELAAELARLDARPLPRTRPLWQLNVVRGLSGPRVAVQLRMHHCVGDGAVFQAVLDELFGRGPTPPATGASTAPPEDDAPAEAVGAAPVTRFSQPPSGERDLALGALPTARLLELKSAAGVTVATLACALTAAALRSWLLARDELPAEPLVALLPASIRRGEDGAAFGNQLRSIRVALPTGEPDPQRRLELAQRGLRAARRRLRDPTPQKLTANLSLGVLDGTRYEFAWAQAPIEVSYTIGIVRSFGPYIGFYTGPAGAGIAVHVDRAQGEGGWSLLEALMDAVDELEACL